MKTAGPPALATWLMIRLASGEKSDSMIGDLMEQYQHGRSDVWYWRQALTAIAFGFGAEMWRNSMTTVGVIAAGYVPQAVWVIVWPAWLVRLDAWYPLLIDTRLSWMVINPWAYRLRLDALTSRILFCSFLAAIAWALTRLHPRQRRLVVTLFLFTQVALCVPALDWSLANWLHEPANPIWVYQALWFAIFMFVEIPFTILYGAYGWRSRSSAKSVAV